MSRVEAVSASVRCAQLFMCRIHHWSVRGCVYAPCTRTRICTCSGRTAR